MGIPFFLHLSPWITFGTVRNIRTTFVTHIHTIHPEIPEEQELMFHACINDLTR